MRKTILASLLLLCTLTTYGQLTNEQADSIDIRISVQNYIDGMMQRNRAKLDLAFHTDARLVGFRGFRFSTTPYKDWAAAASIGEVRDTTVFKNVIQNIDLKGYAAMVTVEMHWPGIYYYDYLTLIRINGAWKIVNKTWYETQKSN